MINKTIARRYARALFAIAEKNKDIEQYKKELTLVVNTVLANPQLDEVLKHQLIEPEKKKSIFDAIFSSQISPIMKNFLHLLMDKRRERFLKEILSEYIMFADQAKNIVAATVRTAVELKPEYEKAIKDKLSYLTGKETRLKIQVDPQLIGGVVVKIGDRVYDGSIKKRLQTLKLQLTKVDFSNDRGEVANEH